LPGGYVNDREEWRAAVLRELWEETSVQIDDVRHVTPAGIYSVDENRKIVLFGSLPPIDESLLENFSANPECPRYQIIFGECELAFSSHTEMVRQFFSHMRTTPTIGINALQVPRGFRCNEE